MTTFTVLHLSDAHIGHSAFGLDARLVLQPLMQEISNLQSTGLSPDLVIFSGDLVFGQLPDAPIIDQFAVAREFLSGVTDGFRIPLFIVPGNHDVNRAKIDPAHQEWYEDTLPKPGADELLHREARKQSPTWRGLLRRHEDWADFVESLDLGCNYQLDQETLLGSGWLNTGIGRVDLIGLNTAWASTKEIERGALRLGPAQLQKAKVLRMDMKGLVIAVGHHPPTWLHQRESSDVEKWLEVETHVYLHGHEHEVWFRDLPSHLRVAAGACYQGSTKENVYQWLRLDPAARTTELRLRTLNTKGGAVRWVPYAIPIKTDDTGVALLTSPFGGKTPAASIQRIVDTPGSHAPTTLKDDDVPLPPRPDRPASPESGSGFHTLELDGLIRYFDEHLHFRWEPRTFNFNEDEISVFWPVRLRNPTAIHAVQAFTAAGLSMKGAKVSLYLDDFGDSPFPREVFTKRVRTWWRSVGADPDALTVVSFRDVLDDDQNGELWRNIQSLLAHSPYDLQQVLRIAKYLPARLDADVALTDFASKRPRKLLTPTLVWTALQSHWRALSEKTRVITLGGWDEQILWTAWWDVVAPGESRNIGHLYNPELFRPGSGGDKPLHMGAANFEWQARGDVVQWFLLDLQTEGDWRQASRMMPWCLNGCVRLPAYVRGSEQAWELGTYILHGDEDLASVEDPNEIVEPLAGAVSKWFFGPQ